MTESRLLALSDTAVGKVRVGDVVADVVAGTVVDADSASSVGSLSLDVDLDPGPALEPDLGSVGLSRCSISDLDLGSCLVSGLPSDPGELDSPEDCCPDAVDPSCCSCVPVLDDSCCVLDSALGTRLLSRCSPWSWPSKSVVVGRGGEECRSRCVGVLEVSSVA
jgi:hypothetical protein